MDEGERDGDKENDPWGALHTPGGAPLRAPLRFGPPTREPFTV